MRLPRFRLRTLMICVAVAALICLVLSTGDHARWIGAVPLQVDLRDRAGRTIVAVAVAPCHCLEDAEVFLAHPDSPELHLVDVPWVPGQPFTVEVICTGHIHRGRELNYHQREALVLRVEYADGSTRFLSAAIPDVRVRRRMSVVVPRVTGSSRRTRDPADGPHSGPAGSGGTHDE